MYLKFCIKNKGGNMATRGAKDGSGKGVGKKGGIRRNKNPTPCNDGTEKGTGKGTRRK